MVLLTERVHPAGLDRLREAGLSLVQSAPGEQGFMNALPRAAAIGVRVAPLKADVIASAPSLSVVAKHGVGTDAIDVAACTARGIPVTVTPDANTVSVAEHTMMLMLAAAKRLVLHDEAVRAGHWAFRDTLSGVELAGRTVLVIGFGRTGQRVAGLCRAFGMDVLVHTRGPDIGGFRRCDDLLAGLAEADVVTLHVPRTGSTANLLSAERIARMRRGAILVNCARGGLVDEAALAEALRDGRLGAAGLDVFDREPFDIASPLASLRSVVLTPHSAASTEEGARRMALSMADSILAALAGRLAESDMVNPEALRHRV